MGRSPCCEKVGLKKGPWTPEEDQKLLAYIDRYGHGSWRALPAKAGLQRCGKSCRLRWTNYLRPDIKRGKFSLQEEQTIIQLHALLGNRWSAIATHLPKRTDNEIKNYWNTHLKKRLTKMGIDPVTHKPKNHALDLLLGSNSKHTNLNHMAQWENARLEAEARLVRESKMTIIPSPSSSSSSVINLRPRLPPSVAPPLKQQQQQPLTIPPCLDILKAWHKQWTTTINSSFGTLESPTSVFNFSSDNSNNNNNHHMMTMINNNNNNNVNDPNKSQDILVPLARKDTLLHDQFASFSVHNDQKVPCINNKNVLEEEEGPSFLEGLEEDLLSDQVFSNMINGFNDHDNDNNLGGCYDGYYYNLEDDSNKYWNEIL